LFPFDLTTFPNDEGYDELVVARSIPVRSVCEHHLLPWAGVGHVEPNSSPSRASAP
jgi:GTP cyclohydrolase I